MGNDDMELVRQYAAGQSESAFGALVSRYTNLVYSAAFRRVGNSQLAEEITQAVFVILAQKAGSLNKKTILPSWLYRTACYVSGHAIKQELGRQRREHEAYMQSLSDEAGSEVWSQITPLLEDAMMRLGRAERDVLVLRFFQGRSLKEVGAALGTSEAATKMRVARALEKLRVYFSRSGVHTTAQTIAGAMTANSVIVAPTTLAKTATAVALAKGATASISTLTLIKGALKVMAWSKAKTAIVVGAGILLVAGTTITVVKAKQGATQNVALMEEMPVKEQMSTMKMLVYPAILNFAQAHQDELPKSLADLKPYLPASLTGVDDEHWEILQSGKVTPEFVTQRNLILLQQKNVPPEKSKIIVYADGHIEYKQ